MLYCCGNVSACIDVDQYYLIWEQHRSVFTQCQGSVIVDQCVIEEKVMIVLWYGLFASYMLQSKFMNN